MKILYVITSTETGGAETALRAQALAAKEAGYTVRVISLKAAGPIGRKLLLDGIEVLSFDLQGKMRLFETAGVLARLVREIESFSPDVVHAFLYRAIELCRLAKRRIPFRLVTTPHYDLSRKNRILRFMDRVLKDSDDLSCAESYTTAEFLKKKQKYSEEKIRLINNGVNSNFFIAEKESKLFVRKKLGLTQDEIVFSCLARLAPEKNHILLLEAFACVYAHNPAVRLILAGEGPEREKLESYICQKKLNKSVFLMGEVTDVKSVLAASDVFILVSHIESLPLALLEACSCSLPAIVSKVGDMPRVVHHGENGFVCNDKDPVLLSALMAELAENADLRIKMGALSRQRIEKYYPAPEQIYLKIYKEFQ